jgi:hypothetical protein
MLSGRDDAGTALAPLAVGATTSRRRQVSASGNFTADEARAVGDKLGVDWKAFDVEQFRMGMGVELEHGARDPETNVTNDDIMTTGKIAWAHLKEFPDYYERLQRMEQEAEAYWDTIEAGADRSAT